MFFKHTGPFFRVELYAKLSRLLRVYLSAYQYNRANIDLLYDQKKANFRIVFGETFTDINFEIDNAVLTGDWNKLRFTIDANNGITCYYNNKVSQSKKLNLKNNCFKLLFGASNEHNFISRDVPPMKIKNIAVNVDGNEQSFWPLDNSEGQSTEDKLKHYTAKIVNPRWIRPQHSNWESLANLRMGGRPSFAFNPVTENMYIISTDSLYTMSPENTKLTALALSVPHRNLLAGNQSIYNKYDNGLYNFYTDQRSVAKYDFNANKWDHNFDAGTLTEFWQSNKFFSNDSNLYVIGGYGQLKYKNTVQQYSLKTKEWDTLAYTGDFFAPRYLAGLGVNAKGDAAYVLGGYGSKEGDQLLSPKYFYDLLRYDVKQKSFKKIYTLPEPEQPFVFGNSLIIDDSSDSYYALVFPNDRFNNNLQLIKGSLTKPTYSLLGNPFPFSFNDVRSFVDLYYCRKKKLLLAVATYTSPDNITEVKVYSIHFPPNELNTGSSAQQGNSAKGISSNLLYKILGILAVLVIGYVFYRIWRTRTQKNKFATKQRSFIVEPVTPALVQTAVKNPADEILKEAGMVPVSEPISTAHIADNEEEIVNAEGYQQAGTPKSSILLFGNFEVITADGHNITKQFTPLLREMFLLILIDSLRYNKGVSSEKLNEILWNDKDIKDAKNNRSVNLVKLKNILFKLGGCTISRETGVWKFEYDPTLINIDFLDYLQVYSHHDKTASIADAGKLLDTLKSGSFLQEIHYGWLDSIKAEISNFVIGTLIKYGETVDIKKETEKTITICNAIFFFDELNEHALKLKCKSLIASGSHTLAKNTFAKFAAKYKEIYGEKYGETYHSVVSE